MRRSVYVVLTSLTLLGTLGVEARGQGFTTRTLVSELDTPWEILWGPDDWIWMTEREGRVSRVNPTTGEVRPLLQLTDVHEEAETGLLGMEIIEASAATYVFLVYTYRHEAQIRERLVRYEYSGGALVEPDTLLTDIPGSATHVGSRLVRFGDNLFMTTGDAQNSQSAQSLTDITGKILRMTVDGEPSQLNPYFSEPYPTNYIWSRGHRNPQGLAVANTILYSSEHGPSIDDEINVIVAGGNYGWPHSTGPCDGTIENRFCQDSNVVEPIKHWSPTVATAGLAYYDRYELAGWNNSLLVVTLRDGSLRRLKLNVQGDSVVSEQVLLDDQFGRLRDVCVAPDGRVFVCTSNRDGRGTPGPTDDRIIEIKAQGPGPSLGRPRISSTYYCSEKRDTVHFETTGQFGETNSFRVELSDANGSFAQARTIGFAFSETGGSVPVAVPTFPQGSGFRIRVVSSQPPIVSQDNGSDITLFRPPDPVVRPSIPFASTDQGRSVLRLCSFEGVTLDAEDSRFVSYHWSTGETTPSINLTRFGTYRFYAEDTAGCTAYLSGIIEVQSITPATAVVTVDGGTGPICEGDTLVLRALERPGYGYHWSTGDTGRILRVTESGDYHLIIRADRNCTDTTDPIQVRFSPRPARPTITADGEVLVASEARTYQWLLNGDEIGGAVERSYRPTQNGAYSVRVENETGCDSTSAPFDFTISDVPVAGTKSDVRIYPLPADDRITVVLDREIAGSVTIVLLDARGEEVRRVSERRSGVFRSEIAVDDLPAGYYTLRVVGDGFDETKKVVIER